MILKKSFKRIASVIVLSVMLSYMFAFRTTPVNSSKRNNNVIDDVMESYNSDKNINIKEYDLYYDKEKSEDYDAEELMALGYYGIKGQNENAKYFLKEAVNKFNNKTEFNVKYMTLNLLISELIKSNEISDALKYLKEVNKFSATEINENDLKIKQILYLTVDITDGRKESIEILERILPKVNNEKIEALNSYRNLLGMYYVLEGQYSNGAEMFLEVIDSNNNTDMYMIKSIIDLGTLFTSLNKFDIAEETFREGLRIIEKENSDGKYNMIMVYGYINLYEILIYQSKYDEFFEVSNEINKYYDGIDKELLDSTLKNYEIIMASAYINTNNLEAAEKYIYNINFGGTSKYIDDDVLGYIVYGDYYLAKGLYEEAIEMYKISYECKKDILNKRYEEMSLQRLIYIYNLQEDYYKELEYIKKILELYTDESDAVSDEYINYIITKYIYKKELEELNRYKVIVTGIVSIISAVTCMIIGQYLKHRKVLKYDGLCGVYKRDYFDYSFKKIFSKNKEFIIIIFDIDNFKMVNDTHGHDFGDRVLKRTAQIAKELVDKKSKVFRYGGEEFVILSKYNTVEEGIALAEKLRSMIEENNWESEAGITISIGVSERKDTMEATFKNADNNLYKAKETGKNKVVY